MKTYKKFNLIFIFLLLLFIFASLFACSPKKVYMVNFHLDDKLLYTYPTKEGKYTGEMPTIENLSNYTFQGWFIDKDKWLIPFDRDYNVKSDLNVHAKYIDSGPKLPLSYKIVFDIDDYEVAPLTVTKGVGFILPIPYTKGKVFNNWFFDKGLTKEYKESEIWNYIKNDNVLVMYGKWDEDLASLFFLSEGTNSITGLTEEGKERAYIYVPSQIDGVTIETIGKGAFSNAKKLQGIEFEIGIDSIDDEAFKDCEILNDVTLPASLLRIGEKAFEDCSNLKNINLPASLSKIGKSAFKNCENLTNTNDSLNFLPASLNVIEDSVFYNCQSLTKINLLYTLTKIENNAFLGSGVKKVVIPNTVLTIGSAAFKNSKIETLEIQQGVEVVGDNAFYNCQELYEVKFTSNDSNKTMKLGKEVFNNCSNKNLKEIDLPDYITDIGTSAFAKCEKLEKITLPKNLGKLSSDLFFGAKKLNNISLPNSIYEIGEGVFMNCESLVQITIPDEVEELKNNVFNGCKNLVSVVLSEKVDLLGLSCFEGCKSLKTISLANITKGILNTGTTASEQREDGLLSDGVFSGCESLETITLNPSIKKIGKDAFANCRKIKVFNSQDLVVLHTIGENAFKDCNSLTKFYLHESVVNIGSNAFKLFTPNSKKQNVFRVFAQVDLYENAGAWITNTDFISYGQAVEGDYTVYDPETS